MSYSDSLDGAVAVISQQSRLIEQCLSKRQLMQALQHITVILTELRNPHLLPKQYYELYVMVFDALESLSQYLIEGHPKHHHLADLYQLVQYTGNIVPRLYMMITVGTSYLKVPGAPREELLKDMIEMCRGVQNPIRGLFLRYYLSQKTKELLLTPEDTLDSQTGSHSKEEYALKFNSNFTVTNFIEMNKLWVRLQYQGPLKERELRTKERIELQILVGSQIVRLSQLIDDNFKVYSKEILPVILEQIIQCKDLISQEYLMDVVFQVFSDQFHFETLPQLLNTTLHLHPEASINKIASILCQRLVDFHEREFDDDEELKSRIKNIDVFEIFWTYLNELGQKRPDLPLKQFISLVVTILNLSYRWYPEKISNINKLYDLSAEIYADHGKMIHKSTDQAVVNLLLALLPNDYLSGNDTRVELEKARAFYFDVITGYENFTKLLKLQRVPVQKAVVGKILDLYFTGYDNKPLFQFDSKLQLERLLVICESMFLVENTTEDANLKTKKTLYKVGGSNLSVTTQVKRDVNLEKLAKFIHIICKAVSHSPKFQDIESQLECALIVRNWFKKSGPYIEYTFPAIINNFMIIIRECSTKLQQLKGSKTECNTDDVETKGAEDEDIEVKETSSKDISPQTTKVEEHMDYAVFQKQCFKFVAGCINDIFNQCDPNAHDMVFKLNLDAASLADRLQCSEIAYDFFSQAITIFEECLTDSRTQYQALTYMIEVLQRTRSLYGEGNYYELLIVKCTMHASKLLKKPDQCRAVYLCSHLWWATEIPQLGEEEGAVLNFYRDGKRVLECLQRALRIADSIMDNAQSCELMVEVLDRSLYYFVHGDENETHVGVKFVNGLIEMIRSNLRSLRMEDAAASEASATAATSAGQRSQDLQKTSVPLVIGPDGAFIETSNPQFPPHQLQTSDQAIVQAVLSHFDRTCEYIAAQRLVDPRFQEFIL